MKKKLSEKDIVLLIFVAVLLTLITLSVHTIYQEKPNMKIREICYSQAPQWLSCEDLEFAEPYCSYKLREHLINNGCE